jgi:hypothetical protein
MKMSGNFFCYNNKDNTKIRIKKRIPLTLDPPHSSFFSFFSFFSFLSFLLSSPFSSHSFAVPTHGQWRIVGRRKGRKEGGMGGIGQRRRRKGGEGGKRRKEKRRESVLCAVCCKVKMKSKMKSNNESKNKSKNE